MYGCILSIDPGKTTGYTLWRGEIASGVSTFDCWKAGEWKSYEVIVNKDDKRVDPYVVTSGYVRPIWEKWRDWRATTMPKAKSVWAIERWIGRGPAASNDIAAQIGWAMIGYRSGWADAYDIGGRVKAASLSIVLQSPADAMTTFPDDRLKQNALYHRGREHARDSLRHGLLALRRCQKSEY